MNLYFISGLAADEKVFRKLTLSPIFSIHYINWIQPGKRESIKNYAHRLTESIDRSKPFILIGLSFGGMIAIEMNRFIHPVKTIIISSAATSAQLPWYIRCLRFLPLYKLMPRQLMVKPNRALYRFIGIKTNEEKRLMNQLLADTDTELLKWSIHAITKWQNKTVIKNLVHIHGDADKLLPIKFTQAGYKIKGGEHFMIYTKAEEISELLNCILN